MENYLSNANPLFHLFTLFGLILSIIYLGRHYYKYRANIDYKNSANRDILSRTKYQEVDTFRMSGPLFRFGLAVAIYASLIAFSWTQYDYVVEYKIVDIIDIEDIDLAPPITKSKPPQPPPPPPPPKIEMIPDDEEPEDVDFIDNSLELDDIVDILPPPITDADEEVPPKPPPPPTFTYDVPDILPFAEQMPRFPGCEDMVGTHREKQTCAEGELLRYIRNKIKYPAMARENGVKGIVVISFVVNTDGLLEDIHIVRDKGAGLGQEALRVIQSINEEGLYWTPGKQRGKKVKVKFNVPVKFKLNR